MEKAPETKGNNEQMGKALVQGSLAFQLGFSVVIPVLGGVFFGRFLDAKFDTHPVLMILLLVIGLIISFFLAKDIVSRIIQSK